MSAADNIGPHLLGRNAPPDYRHLDKYSLVRRAPARKVKVNIARPRYEYDQGQTPKCVAFSTSRVVNWFNKMPFGAAWLYDECKKIDGYPGDGTNARFACDVLRSQGHWALVKDRPDPRGPQKSHGIAFNTWATTVDAIRSVFAQERPQPVLIGIDWYDAWFEPEKRGRAFFLPPPHAAGNVAGGHEIGIWACDDDREAFGLVNTWGKLGWPPLVWLAYADMDTLFRQGADACVIADLPTR